jgi:hypothetical protein
MRYRAIEAGSSTLIGVPHFGQGPEPDRLMISPHFGHLTRYRFAISKTSLVL